MLRNGQFSSTSRHGSVRVRYRLSALGRCARGRRSILIIVPILVWVTRRRRRSSRGSTIINTVLIRVRIRLSVSGTWTFLPSRLLEFPKFVRLLTWCRLTTPSTSVFIMSRSLDCVLGYFNNLASLSLFTSSFHAEVDVYSVEGTEHGLVQCHMIGVNSSSMLSKVIESRECFSTMTRERSLSGMFSSCQHY